MMKLTVTLDRELVKQAHTAAVDLSCELCEARKAVTLGEDYDSLTARINDVARLSARLSCALGDPGPNEDRSTADTDNRQTALEDLLRCQHTRYNGHELSIHVRLDPSAPEGAGHLYEFRRDGVPTDAYDTIQEAAKNALASTEHYTD